MTNINEEVTTESGKRTVSGKIKCVLICLVILAVMLLIQAIGVLIPVLPRIPGFVSESGGNILAAREKLAEYVQSNASTITILMLVGEVVSATVACIWYYFGYVKKDKENKRNSDELPKEKYSGFKNAGFMVCGFLGTWGLSMVLNQIISGFFPQTSQDLSSIMNQLLSGGTVLALLAIAFIGPVFEELAVRGIILGKLKGSFGPIGCIVISAILFGIFHLNIVQGIYVLPMGLFWGFLVYRSKSVIPGIICHMVNNFLGGVLSLFINPLIAFIVFGALAAFIGIKLDYFDLREKKEEEPINVQES